MSLTLPLSRANTGIGLAAFAREWAALGLLALAAGLASLATGLGFHLAPRDAAFLLLVLAAGLGLRRLGSARLGAGLEYFALVILTYVAVSVLTYAAMAMDAPLADARLAAMDRAMGFDWRGWFDFVMAHGWLARVLRFLYFGIGYEAIYFIVLMLLLERRQRLSQMFWLLLLAGSLTALGAWFWPALGPFHQYGMDAQTPFLGEMEHLRTRHDLNFPLGALQGVVSFPSFHTTLALAFAYGFRGTGPVGWIIAGANLVMLLGVPVFGGHYLIDIVAGAAVFAVSAAAIRSAGKISAGRASPESAAASGGACSRSVGPAGWSA